MKMIWLRNDKPRAHERVYVGAADPAACAEKEGKDGARRRRASKVILRGWGSHAQRSRQVKAAASRSTRSRRANISQQTERAQKSRSGVRIAAVQLFFAQMHAMTSASSSRRQEGSSTTLSPFAARKSVWSDYRLDGGCGRSGAVAPNSACALAGRTVELRARRLTS